MRLQIAMQRLRFLLLFDSLFFITILNLSGIDRIGRIGRKKAKARANTYHTGSKR